LSSALPVWCTNQGSGRTGDPCGSEGCRRLPRPIIHPLTSLDFSNAFDTVDRREIASELRHSAPGIYRAGRWALGIPPDLFVARRETGTTYSLSSAQGVRQGNRCSPHVLPWYPSAPGSPGKHPLPTTHFSLSRRHLYSRTLLPEAATHFRHCGAPDRLGHEEICLSKGPGLW
jgi:hypothetical protein